MSQSIEVYMTPDQVAERLQIDPETVRRWLRAKKLRASRISAKAWRISEKDLADFVKQKEGGQNLSEILFEQYSLEQGFGQLEHHPAFPGTTRLVDYRIVRGDQALWFEVKEFAEDKELALGKKGGAFDPYASIRRKIGKAREKFRNHDGECCNLVLFNEGFNLVHISSPHTVLGAMLGNAGFTVPIHLESGRQIGPPRDIFMEGGTLQTDQNTTISSVIALERFPVGHKQFRIKVEQKERNEGRNLSYAEYFEAIDSDRPAYDRSCLRAIVYENPFANKALPRDIFTGPFDERWAASDDKLGLIYEGPELSDLRQAEYSLDLDNPLARILNRRARVSAIRKVQVPQKPNFADFLRDSPLAESGLVFERIKDSPRPLDL